MATENKYASSHITGSVSSPANALGASDGTWTSDTGNTNWTSRWAMDNPTASITGTQTVNVLVRKDSSGGNDPTVSSITLYENGTSVQQLVGSTSITSATGQTLQGTFDASAISNPDNVEIEVATTGAGGSPSSRRAVQVDSIEWVVNLAEATTGDMAATEGADTGSASGEVDWIATLAATEAADTASGNGTVEWSATLAATEGADSASFSGEVLVEGDLSATETGDQASFSGEIESDVGAVKSCYTTVFGTRRR